MAAALRIRNPRGELVEPAKVSASDAKNGFGRILDRDGRREGLVPPVIATPPSRDTCSRGGNAPAAVRERQAELPESVAVSATNDYNGCQVAQSGAQLWRADLRRLRNP